MWTWVALDPDTKIVPCYLVGDRTYQSARVFMDSLAFRLAGRVQLTTDGHNPYLQAVEGAFGADVDYARLIKHYEERADGSDGRYIRSEKVFAQGAADERHVSTSLVERQNLTMRMGMRRFTRATNAHSKKIENHFAAVSLHFLHYNFCRPHMTLTRQHPARYPTTPAMAAGIQGPGVDGRGSGRPRGARHLPRLAARAVGQEPQVLGLHGAQPAQPA